MMVEFIEECWFIYGIRLGRFFLGFTVYHAAGSAGHVEFDWKKAMHPNLLGWIHTHPSGFGAGPSETDNSTMRGWVRGRGKPMICIIKCDDTKGCYEYSRWSDGYIGKNDIKVRFFNRLIWGQV